MPALLLAESPPRLMAELREWAALRCYSAEDAAMELLRIGLYTVREQAQKLPEGMEVTDRGRPPAGSHAATVLGARRPSRGAVGEMTPGQNEPTWIHRWAPAGCPRVTTRVRQDGERRPIRRTCA